MITAARIEEIYQEATTFGAGKLTGREFVFLSSIHAQAQRNSLTSLTCKQAAWFNAIAMKLEATKGKYAFQIIGEKSRSGLQRFRESYEIACFGY